MQKNYEINKINQILDANAKQIGFSLIHINIHSLNANHKCLTESLRLLNNTFHIICSSEIWKINIKSYSQLLDNYTFIYKLPSHSKIGGGVMYISN